MIAGKNNLAVILLVSEACYLYPLYQLTAAGLGEIPAVSSWIFLLLALAAVVINLKLSTGEYRKITLILINSGYFILTFLFLMKPGATGMLMSAISGIFLGWLIIRSRFLTDQNAIDVFKHFDLSLIVIFVMLIIVGSLKIPFSTGISWLMVSIFLNVAALSLNTGKGQGYVALLGAGFTLIVLLPLFYTARYFLPFLFEPAQFIYSAGKPVVGIIGKIAGFLFTGYMTYHANRREQSTNMTTDTNTVQVSGGPAPASPVFAFIMKIVYVFMEIFIIIVVTALFVYLLRLFFIWILRRQRKAIPPMLLAEHKFSWRGLLMDLLLLWDNLRVFLIPWLPTKLDIAKAYKTLLKWGSYRRIPKNADETPFEYLIRLKTQYPQHGQDLEKLTQYYVQYRYGENKLSLYSAEDLKSALRRIFLPRLQFAKNR